jgi:predicted SnoaL-like aldol condensation-catalyzing enzyme
MHVLRTVPVAALFLAGSCLFAQGNAAALEVNKKVVYDFYRVVWEPKNLAALPQYMGDDYVEHNPMFNGGRDDLVRFLKTGRFGDWSKTAPPVDKLNDPPALIMAESDLVTWIFKRNRKDPKDPAKTYESFWFDAFRIRSGKIVEHWDGATRPPQ